MAWKRTFLHLHIADNSAQERELDKVNAFYLQKEAEVGTCIQTGMWLLTYVAQNPSQDIARQEKGSAKQAWNLTTLSQVHDLGRGLPTIRHRSEQTSTICRNQRYGILQNSQEMGQNLEIKDEGVVLVSCCGSSAILQCHSHQRAV